jgi:hypothetical protein
MIFIGMALQIVKMEFSCRHGIGFGITAEVGMPVKRFIFCFAVLKNSILKADSKKYN